MGDWNQDYWDDVYFEEHRDEYSNSGRRKGISIWWWIFIVLVIIGQIRG